MKVNKVQVPLILIQYVRYYLFLTVIHQVIPLAPFQQERLKAVIR